MSGPSPSAAPAPDAYEAIEATMRATEPGRRFLAEHARRARADDTRTLLAAIQRVERTVMADRSPDGVGHLRGDLLEMAEAISRTKAEIAAISEPDQDQTRLALASRALDAIVRSTEQATSDILGAAEAVQEAAWSLREGGAEPAACDALDRHATAIYTACSFQDLTAQRTARIVYTLRYLEDRLAAMIAIWGQDGDRIPPPPGALAARAPAAEDLCQSDVDRYIAMEVPTVTAAALVAGPGAPTLHEDIVFLPVAEVAGPGAPTLHEDILFLPVAEAAEAVAPAPTIAPVPTSAPAGLWAAAAEAPGHPAGPWSGLGLAEIDALSPEMRLALFA